MTVENNNPSPGYEIYWKNRLEDDLDAKSSISDLSNSQNFS